MRFLVLALLVVLPGCASAQTWPPQPPVEPFAYGRLIVHEWVADANDLCFEAHAIATPQILFPVDCVSLRDVRAFARLHGARDTN